jgi:Flp pilus assembly protein TadD
MGDTGNQQTKEPAQAAIVSTLPGPGPLRFWTRQWTFGSLLALAIFIVYLPGIGGGLVWDDDAWTTKIVGLLRDGRGLARMWTTPGALQQFFPLTGTTFWLDYHLWGFNTLPYHIENVLLHICATLLFWKLLSKLKVPGAWLAAAIFGLHPMMVESAGWITERKNLLSMVLFLGALLAYARFERNWEEPQPRSFREREWPFCALALFLLFAALLSKSTTISLPAVLLVICWWKRGRIVWKDIAPTVPFFALAIGLGLATVWVEKNSLGAKGPQWALTLTDRCVNAGHVVWFYAAKLAWPSQLTFIYPRWHPDGHSVAQWLSPISAALTLLALWLLRGRLGRGPAAAAFYFAGTLFPVMGFINIYFMRYSFVCDHWVYLSSLGLFALAGASVVKFGENLRFASAGAVFAAVILPILCLLTWRQSGMYKDIETLYATTLSRNPQCAMAHNNLGMLQLQKHQVAEAKAHFERALEIEPTHASAHNNLGIILLQSGHPDEAKAHFEKALEFDPTYAKAESNLGMIYLHRGQLAEARSHLEKAIQLMPNFADARLNLSTVLMRQGHTEDALRHLERLIELQPNHAYALITLASILATAPEPNLRNGALAVQVAEKADKLTNSQQPMFRMTLATAYAEAGRFAEAIATAQPVLDWAHEQRDAGTAALLQQQISLYRAGKPYRQTLNTSASVSQRPG